MKKALFIFLNSLLLTSLLACHSDTTDKSDTHQALITSLFTHIQIHNEEMKQLTANEISDYMDAWYTEYQKESFLKNCDEAAIEKLWIEVIPDLQDELNNLSAPYQITAIQENEIETDLYHITVKITDANNQELLIPMRIQYINDQIHVIEQY